MPQPIAANLNGASTILAEAFPAGFITFDPLVFYRLDYFKKAERLICKVMLDLRSGATAGSGFSIAETIGEDRYDVSAFACRSILTLYTIQVHRASVVAHQAPEDHCVQTLVYV